MTGKAARFGYFWPFSSTGLTDRAEQRHARGMPAADLLARAASYLQQGRLTEAEALLSECGQALPRPPEWFHLAGVLALQRRQPAAALPFLEQAIAENPQNAHAWNNRGVALRTLNRLAEAEACHRRAVELDPGWAQFYRNRVDCLLALNRHAETESTLRALLAHHSEIPEDHLALGVALQALGRQTEAIGSYRRALTLRPTYWPAAVNLANLLGQNGASAEAERIYRDTLASNPTEPAILYNLANLLAGRGLFPETEELLRRAVERQPAFVEAWINLANHLRLSRRISEAEAAARRATEAKPDSAQAWNVLGAVMREANQGKAAEEYYRRALVLQPGMPEALVNLAHVLRLGGFAAEAEARYRQALAVRPKEAETYNGLGLLYAEAGRLEEGESMLRRALELRPENLKVHSNLLYVQSYLGIRPAEQILAEARQWERHLPSFVRLPPRKPRSARLRVGYLSPDFRRHAVAYFIEPVLEAHDPTQVEVFCYANVPAPDDVTARLQKKAREWHFIQELADEAVAALIRKHEIDVLIDLAGHTRNNRLAVFAYKPAPIQATWLGYFASTGLSAMDYWITDTVLHPTPDAEAASETIWRLPRCYVCYRPPLEAPELACSTEPGTVTFGSFNNLAKLSSTTLQLWARVLRAVPASRLFLKTIKLNDRATRERLLQYFSAEGIASERVILARNDEKMQDHLGRYATMDIALDSFPFTGATTTADTLWMGVPVITLVGTTQPSRVSASMLTAAGFSRWIATNADDYVAKAVALATEFQSVSTAERLARRRTQREQMAASQFCDGLGMARALETAYAEMVRLCSAT